MSYKRSVWNLFNDQMGRAIIPLSINEKDIQAILNDVIKINNLSYKNNSSSYCSDLFFKLPIPDNILQPIEQENQSRVKTFLFKSYETKAFTEIFDSIVKDSGKKIRENREALESLKSLDENDNYYLNIKNKERLKAYLNNITKDYMNNVENELDIKPLTGDVKYVIDNNNDKYIFEYDFIKLGGLKKDFSDINDDTKIIDIREYFYFCNNKKEDNNNDLFKIDINFLVNYLYKVKVKYDNDNDNDEEWLGLKIPNENPEHKNIIVDNDAKIASNMSKINIETEIVKTDKFKIIKINDNDGNAYFFIKDYIDFNYTKISDAGILNLTKALNSVGNKEYYLRLTDKVKNILELDSFGSEYIFLVLGKKDSIREKGKNGEIIYFTELIDNNDNEKLADVLNGNLYIKNPDISGGKRKRQTMRNKKIQRKRRTMKRAKMRRTRHRKRVNRRHSKKYI